VATVRALAARPDSFETATTIDVSALVIVGEEDALTPPAEARELAGHLPVGGLVEIPAAGHLTPLEKPNEVKEELFVFLSNSFPPAT
jgi:pimeloyl-ACP methyl ester carboxylesterase